MITTGAPQIEDRRRERRGGVELHFLTSWIRTSSQGIAEDTTLC